jgi:glycosyltransferase involved in cell wall biosynthesis
LKVSILGTRGVPAGHSGFETFAEQFALYLVERHHEVTVYCQIPEGMPEFRDTWNGIKRIAFSEGDHPVGTIRFDLRTVIDACKTKDAVVLTLGYNTAIFSLLYRLRGVRNYMNMDGIEWIRQKWSRPAQLWLRANEWLGAHLANHLVADHPEIKNHLLAVSRPEKITVIPYAAYPVGQADESYIRELGLEPNKYFLVIARSEPENSILEIVKAQTARGGDYPLVVLGKYKPDENPYHAQVFEAAKEGRVLLPGAIFDKARVQALRYFSTAYIHGHQVGGTNPSLVEALAAGNAVIAHNNRFNRWVCGSGSRFFETIEQLSQQMNLLEDDTEIREEMRNSSTQRYVELFQPEMILGAYEHLMMGLPVDDSRWLLS